MLGLLLIYFIGRHYYKLAETYEKNKWLFAILGILAYYAGTFLAGILLGILIEFFAFNFNLENRLGLSLIAMPFGLLTTFTFYSILKPNWKEQAKRKLFMEQQKAKAFEAFHEEE